MTLTSSLLLILGSSLHWVLHRRAAGAARLIPPVAAAAALLAVALAGSASSAVAVWRPTELFGPGLEFKLFEGSRPFLLLACSLFLVVSLRPGGRFESLQLAYWGVGLAAGLGSTPLSVALSWTLMSIMEAALELGRGAEPSTLIRRMLPHAAAALLLIVSEAAPIGTWAGLAGVVVGSAILLRSSSLAAQTTEADPLRSAWLNPIVALAACGQLLGDRAGLALPGVVGLLWWIVRLSGRPAAGDSTYPALVAAGLLLAGGPDGELWRTPAAAASAVQLAAAAILFGRRQWAPAVGLGLSAFAVLALSQPGLTELLLGVLGLGLGAGASQAVQRILPRRSSDRGRRPLALRIDIHDDLSRAWELVARWIRSGTELLEGQSAVLWMFLAVLAIVIAIGGSPG